MINTKLLSAQRITYRVYSPPLHATPYTLHAGFTLLELMISVTIIGIIVLMVGSAMRLGFRSVSSGEKKIESLERMRASLNIIDSQIQSGIPLVRPEGKTLYYFKGNKESLQLSSDYSIWGVQRGFVIASYRVMSDEHGKKSLYVSENIIGIKEKREAKLLEGFDEIYFEYFYKDLLKKEERWIVEWTDDSLIPKKVRLNLIDGTKKVSLIIPIRARSLGF